MHRGSCTDWARPRHYLRLEQSRVIAVRVYSINQLRHVSRHAARTSAVDAIPRAQRQGATSTLKRYVAAAAQYNAARW